MKIHILSADPGPDNLLGTTECLLNIHIQSADPGPDTLLRTTGLIVPNETPQTKSGPKPPPARQIYNSNPLVYCTVAVVVVATQ